MTHYTKATNNIATAAAILEEINGKKVPTQTMAANAARAQAVATAAVAQAILALVDTHTKGMETAAKANETKKSDAPYECAVCHRPGDDTHPPICFPSTARAKVAGQEQAATEEAWDIPDARPGTTDHSLQFDTSRTSIPPPKAPGSPTAVSDCPHCPDGHTPSGGGSQPWNAYVGPERDGDGQPITIHVARSAGAHVAESDARWIYNRLNGSS